MKRNQEGEILCPDCDHSINIHRFICQAAGCSCVNSASEIANMMMTEKNNRLTQLEQAAQEIHIFLTQADFDFRNGNEAQGIDEGEYYGRKVLKEITDKLAALLNQEPTGTENERT